jgi:hypothetical protein
VLESVSVSYGKATPYFPVIDLLRRYCHVADGDEARTVRAKVTGQVLTLDETLQEAIPALLALLDALPADSPFLCYRPLSGHGDGLLDVCFVNALPVPWERRRPACFRSGLEARAPRRPYTGTGLVKWTSSCPRRRRLWRRWRGSERRRGSPGRGAYPPCP